MIHFYPILPVVVKYNQLFRTCLNFARHCFEICFRGYFSVFVRSITGYVTNRNRETGRKETQKKLNKKLSKQNLNRLLL